MPLLIRPIFVFHYTLTYSTLNLFYSTLSFYKIKVKGSGEMKKTGRIIICIISVIFLIWFILPIQYNIINPGNILGVIICLYLIFWSAFNKKYKDIKTRLCGSGTVRILWRIFNVCATVFIAYAVIISFLMVFTAFSFTPKANATAVVLGAQVKPWGPSVLLQQRIDASIKYLNENPDAKAVVTGGKGSDEPISEAESMYQNIKKRINKERIFKEDNAVNTMENLSYSSKIIKEKNLNKNIAIVTDSYHQLRSRIIAKKLGINSKIGSVNTINGKIGIINYPTFFVREWIAIPVEIIKPY